MASKKGENLNSNLHVKQPHVSGGSIISLRDLWLILESQAGPVEILRGVDLEISAGQSVSVTGPSGAGKTSLMMVIGAMERPTSGDVQVAGNDLRSLDEESLARHRRHKVGIVFQSFHLIPTMTALENVAIPLEFSGAADAFARAADDLAAVNLSHRVDHYPGQLSGGEQQRVAIARALISEPDLILADEPTGNLDGENSADVMNLLFRRCEAKTATLILITHQSGLAQRCDRHVEMADGKIVSDSRFQIQA